MGVWEGIVSRLKKKENTRMDKRKLHQWFLVTRHAINMNQINILIIRLIIDYWLLIYDKLAIVKWIW